jgi:5-methylcytosine-specific restriction protein B
MTLKELGDKLNEMYSNAPNGDSVAMIHLFGIKYANEILLSRFSKKDIAIAASIPESYGTEISKGVKLSKYVKEL